MTRDELVAISVNGGPGAAAAARRALVAADGSLPTPVREDLLLLVTELVTNAVRHADVGPEQSLDLELRLAPGHVRVEVADPGEGFDPDQAPRGLGGPGGAGGWGLHLIKQIADDWGIRPTDPGTAVWFELRFAA